MGGAAIIPTGDRRGSPDSGLGLSFTAADPSAGALGAMYGVGYDKSSDGMFKPIQSLNSYQIDYGGKDFTGNDLLAGFQREWFNERQGVYSGNNDQQYWMDNRAAYGYDPLQPLLEGTHLADLRGNKWLKSEVDAYNYAVSKLQPYITDRNPDGTYNLKIPTGAQLTKIIAAPNRVGENPDAGNTGKDNSGYFYGYNTTGADTVVRGINLILNDNSRVAEYIQKGGGILGRLKEAELNGKPLAGTTKEIYRAQNPTIDQNIQNELNYTQKYRDAVSNLENYKQDKNAMRRTGGGSSSNFRAPGLEDDQNLRLQKPTLLG